MHLRKGSYRTLPHSRPQNSSSSNSPYTAVSTLPDEEEDVDDFYHLPVRAPQQASGHVHTPSGSSVASFADFVSAPGKSRRFNGPKGLRKPSGLNPANSKGSADGAEEVDEVLFDEDELSVGGQLKGSTDDSASASGSGGRDSPDEERAPLAGGGSTRRPSRTRGQ